MAQVLQSPDAWDPGLEPAPAHAGPIQHRPDQRQAAVLAGQAPDHLDPAPALAEGPLQEVGKRYERRRRLLPAFWPNCWRPITCLLSGSRTRPPASFGAWSLGGPTSCVSGPGSRTKST